MKLEELALRRVALPLHSEPLGDIPAKVREQMETLRPGVRPGMQVALAVGSRGIANLARIVGEMVKVLKGWGAAPFIVPAMGSHGGATAEGQAGVLAGYGITEDAVGAPVRSSMEVVPMGQIEAPETVTVYMDKNAYGADGVIVVNRVKPHTDFHGAHESGVVKMLVIGLGKQAQALAIHRYGVRGLSAMILPAAEKVLASGKILGALAILEDGRDNTADIACATAPDIPALDSRFLARSRRMMARLPWPEIDVLIVDEMGKDITGAGMDTNVIGRMCLRGAPDGEPRCGRIVTLDLTEKSHGNALGVGLADIITRRLADKIDWETTLENVITSGFLERGFCPIVRESDRAAIALALASCARPEAPRVVRIKNTLELGAVDISDSLHTGSLETLRPPAAPAFGGDGALAPF